MKIVLKSFGGFVKMFRVLQKFSFVGRNEIVKFFHGF